MAYLRNKELKDLYERTNSYQIFIIMGILLAVGYCLQDSALKNQMFGKSDSFSSSEHQRAELKSLLLHYQNIENSTSLLIVHIGLRSEFYVRNRIKINSTTSSDEHMIKLKELYVANNRTHQEGSQALLYVKMKLGYKSRNV